jgi:pyruvate dehydrogenase E2 component (dihydrolipoamide acetyltransferase)
MPKMGDGMEEGTLVEWLKGDGESVKSGEVIGTIQTDKATLELEAPGSGKLTGFLIDAGETVPVGQPIAAILKEGESLPEGWGGKDVRQGGGESRQEAAPASDKAGATAPIERQQEATTPETPEGASAEFGVPAEQQTAATGQTQEESAQESVADRAETAARPQGAAQGRIKASPLARRQAEERGIDLSSIEGSGPGGRIVARDVAEAKPAAKTAAEAPAAAAQEVKLNRLRQLTAKRTTESKQQVPHFYVTVEVDLERIDALREMFEAEESGKVSINDFVVKACALALKEMPVVNSSYEGDRLQQHGGVHIGIAAAVEEGLTVPVIRDAGRLSLREISTRAKELVKKARENKLGMDELTGSTFSISNMGMLDVDNFVAIINPPNAAILAISSARKRVVVNEEDEIEVRRKMNVTASFDHRVVDGAVGAQFVNLVKAYLENPTRLIG